MSEGSRRFVRDNKTVTGQLALSIVLLFGAIIGLIGMSADSPYVIILGSVFLGFSALVFVTFSIELLISIIRFISNESTGSDLWETQPAYLCGRIVESIAWGSCIVSVGYFSWFYYSAWYVHTGDVISLFLFSLIVAVIGVAGTAFRGMLQWMEYSAQIRDEFSENLTASTSHSTVVVSSVLCIVIIIVLYSLVLAPVASSLVSSPAAGEYPGEFDRVMDAKEFGEALPHTEVTEQEQVMAGEGGTSHTTESRYIPLSDDARIQDAAEQYNIFNSEQITIGLYSSPHSMDGVTTDDFVGDFSDANVEQDTITEGVALIIEQSDESEDGDSISTIYSNTTLSNYQYSEGSEKTYSAMTANNRSYALPLGIESRVTIDDEPYDIDTWSSSNTGENHIDDQIGSDYIMVATGTTEYYGEPVIIYEGLWNQLPEGYGTFSDQEINYADSVTTYIHAESGQIVWSEESQKNSDTKNIFKVSPSDNSVESPGFVDEYRDNTDSSVNTSEDQLYHDIDTDDNIISLTVYGFDHAFEEYAEFVYGSQSKSVDLEEFTDKEYGPDNPLVIEFEKKSDEGFITVETDFPDKSYTIEVSN